MANPAPIKPEMLLAELDRLRKDLDADKSNIEWLTLYHAFCFISYKMTDFRKYVADEAAKGAFDEVEAE
ncbi:hypothetical protein BH11PLA1_BH11PLA1_03430 [soil metagenome]